MNFKMCLKFTLLNLFWFGNFEKDEDKSETYEDGRRKE